MQLFQTSDVLLVTGLTRHQLREWTGSERRALLAPDVPARGPGRHALFSWQTLLVLRLLRVLQSDFRVEVSAWSPAANSLRQSLEHRVPASLWRSVVFFPNNADAEIFDIAARLAQGLVMPLHPHLVALS